MIAKLAPNEAVFSSAVALPGGASLVSVHATANTDDASRVAVLIPGQSERLVIAERGGSPTFVTGDEPGFGHVVYAESGRLMALPFDAARRVVKGSPVPIVENVAMRPNGDRADYTVSTTGTLIFREGSLHELVWIDRDSGAVRPLSANLRRFALPRLSPDGKRLAMEIQDSPHQIWMLDIERDFSCRLQQSPPVVTTSRGPRTGTRSLYTIGGTNLSSDGYVRMDHPTPRRLPWLPTRGSSWKAGAVTVDAWLCLSERRRKMA